MEVAFDFAFAAGLVSTFSTLTAATVFEAVFVVAFVFVLAATFVVLAVVSFSAEVFASVFVATFAVVVFLLDVFFSVSTTLEATSKSDFFDFLISSPINSVYP